MLRSWGRAFVWVRLQCVLLPNGTSRRLLLPAVELVTIRAAHDALPVDCGGSGTALLGNSAGRDPAQSYSEAGGRGRRRRRWATASRTEPSQTALRGVVSAYRGGAPVVRRRRERPPASLRPPGDRPWSRDDRYARRHDCPRARRRVPRVLRASSTRARERSNPWKGIGGPPPGETEAFGDWR